MTRATVALLIAAVLAAAGWGIHKSGLDAGRAEIQAKWDQQRITAAAAAVQANLQARAREQALQFTADKIRQEKIHEIRRLSAAHDAVVRELRNSPERPADYLPASHQAAGAGPGASCSADRLYREDAAVALGIARDADVIRAALMECRAAYEAAQAAVE